jgi:hypothetical protein
LLTIEITETSSLIDRAEAVHNLSLLEILVFGFRLMILARERRVWPIWLISRVSSRLIAVLSLAF